MNAPTTMSVAGLCAALVAAQAAARAVAKDAQNTFHRYKYASAEAIIAEAREALAASGLALMTVLRRFVAAAPDAPGGVIGRVELHYLLVHTSGETLPIESSTPVIPEKGRPADKAEAAAVTQDLAYLLRGLLLLPRDDDAAAIDARDDRRFEPRGGSAPAAPGPKAGRDWSEVVSVVESTVAACTTVDQLKAEVVPLVNKAQSDGMPGELVQRCRDLYGERKAALTSRAA